MMKGCIGRLLMLAIVSFAFVGVNETSAMNKFPHKAAVLKQQLDKTKRISMTKLSPEVFDFISEKVKLPEGNTAISVGGKNVGVLKFADLEQARADHMNGIEVFDGLGTGDSVSIGGVYIFNIVE